MAHDLSEAAWISEPPAAVGKTIRYVFPFMGLAVRATGEITSLVSGRLERLHIIGGPMGMSPMVTFRVEPANGGATFTRIVEVDTSGIQRLLEPLFRRMIGRRNERLVQQFAKALAR